MPAVAADTAVVPATAAIYGVIFEVDAKSKPLEETSLRLIGRAPARPFAGTDCLKGAGAALARAALTVLAYVTARAAVKVVCVGINTLSPAERCTARANALTDHACTAGRAIGVGAAAV